MTHPDRHLLSGHDRDDLPPFEMHEGPVHLLRRALARRDAMEEDEDRRARLRDRR